MKTLLIIGIVATVLFVSNKYKTKINDVITRGTHGSSGARGTHGSTGARGNHGSTGARGNHGSSGDRLTRGGSSGSTGV